MPNQSQPLQILENPIDQQWVTDEQMLEASATVGLYKLQKRTSEEAGLFSLTQLGLNDEEILEASAVAALLGLKKRKTEENILNPGMLAIKARTQFFSMSIEYKILAESYTKRLKEKGYSKMQILYLLGCPDKLSTMQVINEMHARLIELKFTREQIIILAEKKDAATTINAVITHFNFLHNSGFSHDEIIGIVKSSRGGERLSLLVENYNVLKGLRHTHNSIVSTFTNTFAFHLLKSEIKQAVETTPPLPERSIFTLAQS